MDLNGPWAAQRTPRTMESLLAGLLDVGFADDIHSDSADDESCIAALRHFADDGRSRGTLRLESHHQSIDFVGGNADEQPAGSLRVVEKLQAHRIGLPI